MKKHLIMLTVIILSFFLAGRVSLHGGASDLEIEAVKRAVVDGYINGVFLKGDADLMKKGFHPDCDVLVLNKGTLMKVQAYSYVDRFEKNPGPLNAGTTHKFTDVHVTGYAALAIVEIFQQGKHIYTDYISLYKFEDGWKCVTKIYYRHPGN